MTHRPGDSSANILSKCLLLNARSLNQKLPEFHKLLRDDFSVLFITESWLSESVTNGMLDNTGLYNIYRKDRPYKRGGGVIGLVTKDFNSYFIPLPSIYDSLELISFVVVTDLGTYRFIVVYRPPDYNQHARDHMLLLCECLKFLCETTDTVILVGDLNLPKIDWSVPDSPNDNIHSLFLDCSTELGLTQFVEEPTHENNCLDLVLTNDPLIVSDISVSCPFSSSDHCMINFSLVLCPHDTACSGSAIFYDYDHADFESMNTALFDHPFNDCIVVANSNNNVTFTDSVDVIWDKFVLPINSAISEFVPIKSRRSGVCKSQTGKRKTYLRHITRAVKRKVGCFYRYVNKKLSCKSGVGPLRSDSGNVITDDTSKANLLNNYFQSVLLLTMVISLPLQGVFQKMFQLVQFILIQVQ